MKQSLTEIFKRIGHFGSDIGCNDKNGTHTYTETYDKVLEPYRNGCTFMEIGLAMGDSIKLFDEYFENSKIIGVDISVVFEIPKYKNDVQIIQADATKVEFLKQIDDYRFSSKWVDKDGYKCADLNSITTQIFDVIIDDGSHITQDQIDTFNLLKGKMNKGGIYIIEDILALDIERKKFEALHDNCEIIDMRSNGRFDNVLIIYRF